MASIGWHRGSGRHGVTLPLFGLDSIFVAFGLLLLGFVVYALFATETNG
ncbi:MAG: hypothetical protein ACREFQ_08495 [Stellaceae bacterium]